MSDLQSIEYLDRLTPKAIWCLKQNRPSLVARDLERFGVPREVTHAVLLARGVYKWLAARRDLIRLKDKWRDELTELYRRSAKMRKGTPEHRELVGYIKALEKCRAEIRAICHSDRFRAPDTDREAQRFIERLREGNNAKREGNSVAD